MGGPLTGFRVLDFSEGAQGPYAAALLADMGAEIIKVERPGRGDLMRESPPFKNGVSLCCLTINRGKKAIILDLKNSEDIGKALRVDQPIGRAGRRGRKTPVRSRGLFLGNDHL
jgi:crotonobetainyl-CoA:carnitine CoA-transferase CaiB-like acyl-CoA transferase